MRLIDADILTEEIKKQTEEMSCILDILTFRENILSIIDKQPTVHHTDERAVECFRKSAEVYFQQVEFLLNILFEI